ncbi:MAG TPA: AMP-binding protein [Bacillota bacterium]|nr:AMP-binding protein [Bacillota bacterium]HOL10594.1 AMP-binding protein [Bacillota bacterium]HPO97421.1 AMP-binding protein [Bacillota bacterium]
MSEGLFRKTIGNLIDDWAAIHPDRDCLVYHDRGLRLSYKDFQQECNQVAKAFMALGLGKGNHIAIWSTNYPEWVITQFATGKMGAPMVTVNTAYRVYELEYLLKQSDSTTLILMQGFKDVDYVETIYQICPELKECEPGQLKSERLPLLKNVIFLGEKKYPGMFTWEEFKALGNKITDQELIERQKSVQLDDVTCIMYTSGTTGFPKGVMLTHLNLVADAYYIAECMKLTPEDRMCIPVPFFHCFGCVLGTLACVSHGGTMVPIESFNPVRVLEAVEQERCTVLHGVPTMFISELQVLEEKHFDTSSLRTGIMAGSPCPIEIMKQVVEKMGARELTIAYGLTESSPVMSQTRTDDPIELRVSTVGRALPNVEIKIVDPNTGETVPYGVPGEICTRGFLVMKGYYKMPEATAEAIDKDGWLHSGDLGTMDENGYLKITGRVKDMIIRGGENIYPRELEEFLYTHPKVRDVQVVGVPDIKYGEEVAACIILKEGETATEEEFREYMLDRISKFKHPRYILFMNEYPITASGKIQKYKLRQQLVELLNLQAAEEVETA